MKAVMQKIMVINIFSTALDYAKVGIRCLYVDENLPLGILKNIYECSIRLYFGLDVKFINPIMLKYSKKVMSSFDAEMSKIKVSRISEENKEKLACVSVAYFERLTELVKELGRENVSDELISKKF